MIFRKSEPRYRIISEDTVNGLGGKTTKYWIQKKYWFWWWHYGTPVRYHWDSEGHYLIARYFTFPSLERCQQHLEEIKINRDEVYKGNKIIRVFSDDWKLINLYINKSTWKIGTNSNRAYKRPYQDIDEIKKDIDSRLITKSQSIVSQ